jgi:hypothetical protein
MLKKNSQNKKGVSLCVDMVIVCVLGVAIFYVCPPSFFLIQNSRPSRMVPRVCRNILYGNVKFWIPQNMFTRLSKGYLFACYVGSTISYVHSY